MPFLEVRDIKVVTDGKPAINDPRVPTWGVIRVVDSSGQHAEAAEPQPTACARILDDTAREGRPRR
jgi:hypothetical protein